MYRLRKDYDRRVISNAVSDSFKFLNDRQIRELNENLLKKEKSFACLLYAQKDKMR
jgi:hypothetical protein